MKRQRKTELFQILFLVFLLIFDIISINAVRNEAFYLRNPETERLFREFRKMAVMEEYTGDENWDDYCIKLIIDSRKKKEINVDKMKKYHPDYFKKYKGYLKAIYNDAIYFPIPQSGMNDKKSVYFCNSWMEERTFGGKRGHEGCDIMASVNEPGIYPVLSISDGYVDKMGWLTQGGYRIGIRTDEGVYFYYAHLSEYADGITNGDKIEAGQLLGFMGNTGYGKEGTTGMFDVHLHFGIYLQNEQGMEFSVNPYFLLRYLENKKLQYDF